MGLFTFYIRRLCTYVYEIEMVFLFNFCCLFFVLLFVCFYYCLFVVYFCIVVCLILERF